MIPGTRMIYFENLNPNTPEIGEVKIGELTQKIYDTLTGIQTGKEPDPFGWVVEVEETL